METPNLFDSDESNGNNAVLMPIVEETNRAFMQYAMSVITSRALPDVRDGLKPAQRRIVYSMVQTGLTPNGRHHKCATVVGDVMARFHPHGDQAIYDTMVRLAQPHTMRVPLVDPQGNFGTVDDPAAQMRYTECRTTTAALSMCEGIHQDTVDMVPNYDGEHSQPAVLPALFPNLVINGSQGIAVGLATQIPPHCPSETMKAIELLISNRNVTDRRLFGAIRGPDFPGGAPILQTGNLVDYLKTGRGKIEQRARLEVADLPRGKQALVATHLPYQASAEKILEQAAKLVEKKTLTAVTDMRNESSARAGTRLVFELRQGADPAQVAEILYARTPLHSNFSANMVALVDGQPKQVGVREMLAQWLDHRMEVLVRRTRHALKETRLKAHLTEGLVIAVENLDEVIAIVRRSRTDRTALASLRKRFKMSEEQAEAVLSLTIRRLVSQQVSQLRERLKQLKARIKTLETLLGSEKNRWKNVRSATKDTFEKIGNTERICPLVTEASIVSEKKPLYLSNRGRVRRFPLSGVPTTIRQTPVAALLDPPPQVLVVTDRGQTTRVNTAEVSDSNWEDIEDTAGTPLALLPWEPSSKLLLVTQQGETKMVKGDQLNTTKHSDQVLTVKRGDQIVGAFHPENMKWLWMVTNSGKLLRTRISQFAGRSKTAGGVAGIELGKTAGVVAAHVTSDNSPLELLLWDGNQSTLVNITNWPSRNRATQGKNVGVSNIQTALFGDPHTSRVVTGAQVQNWPHLPNGTSPSEYRATLPASS